MYVDFQIFDDMQQATEYGAAVLAEYDVRLCYVSLNMSTFNSAYWNCNYTVLFLYQGANFNISLPKLADFKRDTYDAIGTLPNVKRHYLPDDYAFYCDRLPNGWNSADYRYYNRNKINAPCLDIEAIRLNWNYGAPYIGLHLIHPKYERLLTEQEYAELEKNNLQAWLDLQLKLFNSGYWKANDYCTKYCADSGSWQALQPIDTRQKLFDISTYRSPARYTQKNIDSVPNCRKANFIGSSFQEFGNGFTTIKRV